VYDNEENQELRSHRAMARRLAGAFVLSCAGFTASGRGIVDLGLPPGATGMWAQGISGDGRVVVGHTVFSNDRAVRWTAVDGVQYLSGQTGVTAVAARATNWDGTVVVGDRYTANPSHAFRWTSAGMTDLGSLPGSTESYGRGVSGDGSVVVGYAHYPSSPERGFRWTGAGGMQPLASLPGHASSQALGISGDGAYIVGNSTSATGEGRLVRWTIAGDVEDLGSLPQFGNHEAHAANVDGSVIVGRSGVEAVRWKAGEGLQTLARPAGVTAGIADVVSADGSVIAGRLSRTVGPFAMMWTQGTGMVELNQFLPTIGVNVTGWNLQAVTGVSADGLTLTGYGAHDGAPRAWVVTIPGPGALGAYVTAGAWALRRRRP
jgi:probable HAF family extracellular repeat protein